MNTDRGHRWLSLGAEVLAQEVSADPSTMHCDVLIVGSGYGGAVAAARLAGATPRAGGAPIRVIVLERGNEYLPGEFPATFAELPGHVRFSAQDGAAPRGRPTGLFDLRLGKDVSVLLGNGLGGGSLINAAVMERAGADAFADGSWPGGIDERTLEPFYGCALQMLEPETIPGEPAKLRALMASAGQMSASEYRKAHVAVAFADGITKAGVGLAKCLECGDCVSGCNHRAKKSLDVNYLASAKAKGAELYCGATVHALHALAGASGYEVAFFLTDPQKAPADPSAYRLRARRVILAAGSLGSTEILLRSHALGLPLAGQAQLGRRFSTNGDMIMAAYGQHEPAHCGTPEGVVPARRAVGPTITGLARVPIDGARPLVFEEFGIPAPLYRLLGEVVTATAMLHTRFEPDTSVHRPGETLEDPLAVSADRVDHSLVYGVMGDDGAVGAMSLATADGGSDGQITITWKGIGDLPLFDQQLARLRAAHEPPGTRGGRVLPNPLWRPLPPLGFQGIPTLSRGVFTVHPLGGCAMATDATSGVVDHAGRVFAADAETPTLPGLAVLDGSIVPVALGINPALTIAALAERALPMLADDWCLVVDTSLPPLHPPRPMRIDRTQPETPASTRFTLHERMTGRLRIGEALLDCSALIDFDAADVAGLRRLPRVIAFSRVALTFTDAHRIDPPFQASCTGHAEVLVRDHSDDFVRRLRALRPALRRLSRFAGFCVPTSAAQWQRDLLALCSHLGAVRLIRYHLTVSDSGNPDVLAKGTQLRLTKRLEFTDSGNPWRQLSEGVVEQVDACHVELGALSTDLSYFAEQMVPLLRIEHQHDAPNALGDLAELLLWILRVVLETHLLNFLPPEDKPPGREPQRLPGPVSGIDPVQVSLPNKGAPGAPERKLSRYQPTQTTEGTRPVLLIHGYGASGSTFTHPDIGPDGRSAPLVASLLDAGRDVWVLELRTSIALPENRGTAWMFDETAQADIPEAIAHVLEHSTQGAGGKVDVIAHCIGAAMFSVAVVGSTTALHERIGCAVLSQVAPLVTGSPMNRFRAYVASYLQQYLGVQSFDVRPPADDAALMLLLDGILNTFPYPDDDGEAQRLHETPGFAAVRHRADAIFGQTMRLANIGNRMLGTLESIYGFVSTAGLAQVGHYVSRQVLTDATGQNQTIAFETLGERFGFPLLILHGRHNRVFDWRGSFRAHDLLKQVFDGQTNAHDIPSIGDDDLHLGAGTPRQLRVLGNYGHQDTLIGQRAYRDVFPHIVAFLNEFVRTPSRHKPAGPPLVLRPPWTGPTLGAVQRVSETELRANLALRAPRGHASTLAVLLVPATRGSDGWALDLEKAMAVFTSSSELVASAIVLRLNVRALPRYQGIAVLTVHTTLPAPIDRGAVISPKTEKTGLFVDPDDEPNPRVLELVAQWRQSVLPERIDETVIRLDPAWIAAAQLPGQPPQRSLCLALASCQYPAGLFDAVPAQASYARLARRLDDSRGDEPRPQLLLLAGDQVYVDETAGLFTQPGGSAIDRAYEVNHRLEAYRRVTRSLPTYPMLDDHEVRDNWEPPPAAEAIDAYRQRQHKLVNSAAHGPFSYRAQPAGLPMLVLDTRSARDRRGLRIAPDTTPLHDARIVQSADAAQLQQLLSNEAHARDPKFVVSPVAVFPLHRATVFGQAAERIALDDWGGFPRSQLQLLQQVRDGNVRHVVLLAGDRHLSSVSSLWLARPDGSDVEIISIVSSGLYAPWPFANARPDEFWLDGPFTTVDGAISGHMQTPLVGGGDGYALVSVTRGDDAVWTIDVVLDLASGTRRATRRLDGDRRTGWQVWP